MLLLLRFVTQGFHSGSCIGELERRRDARGRTRVNVECTIQLGFTNLPAQKPEPTEEAPLNEQVLKDLHKLLLEVHAHTRSHFLVLLLTVPDASNRRKARLWQLPAHLQHPPRHREFPVAEPSWYITHAILSLPKSNAYNSLVYPPLVHNYHTCYTWRKKGTGRYSRFSDRLIDTKETTKF